MDVMIHNDGNSNSKEASEEYWKYLFSLAQKVTDEDDAMKVTQIVPQNSRR